MTRKIICFGLFVLMFCLMGQAQKAHAVGTLIPISSAAYNSSINNNDPAFGAAVDGSENIIVTGGSYNGSNDDYFTIKYDSNCVVLSSASYNGTGNGADTAQGVVVDGSGNIIVTGYSDTGPNNDYFTIKYDSSFSIISSATYNGASNGDDRAKDVVIDVSGNIIVTGYSHNGSNYDYFTIKYSSNLVVLSSAAYDGAGVDEAESVAVDGSGNIIVTGYSNTGTSFDYFTIKYSSHLVVLSSAVYNGTGATTDGGTSVVVDGSENIIVTGYSNTGSSTDYFTIKYNSNLSTVLASTAYDGGNGTDVAQGVVIDGSGNIIVTGYSDTGPSNDYFTIKYDSSFSIISSASYNGTGNGADVAQDVVIDGSGNIIVTGYIDGGTNNDYFTIIYNGQAPTVSTISSDSGHKNDTMNITITGTNFYDGAEVSFSETGMTVNSITVDSLTQITANISIEGDAPSGLRNVTVTNIDEMSATKTSGFEVKTAVSQTGTIDPTVDSSVVLEAETGDIRLDIPANTFSEALSVTISTANAPSSSEYDVRLTNLVVEITNSLNEQPGGNVTITVYYRDQDIPAGYNEADFVITRYDETSGKWYPLSSTVFTAENKVVAVTDHLSIFAVAEISASNNLNNLIAFPNPLNPNVNTQGMIIDNLTETAVIKIYNVAGELIKTVPYTSRNGRAEWDGTNNNGSKVASGVYIVYVKADNGTKKIKVAIEK